jgi:hypothetical protein
MWARPVSGLRPGLVQKQAANCGLCGLRVRSHRASFLLDNEPHHHPKAIGHMETTMKRSCLILSLPVLLALSAVGHAQAFSNDCTLQFAGSFRKVVKNRPAAEGATYTVHNDGQPITVADWFGFVCGFDPKLKQEHHHQYAGAAGL